MGVMSEDSEGRFRAHKHYVEAFGMLAGKKLTTLNPVALQRVAVRASAVGVPTDRQPPAIDYAQVHKSLRNAWSTEVLLALPGEWARDEDEFIRLSNTWGLVQAYYVGYHATQALIVAKGARRPASHPQTQRQYSALWVDRPLELAPWTFGVCDAGWKNKPAGVTIDLSVNAWTACSESNCWSLAAKVLKSTRDEYVQAAFNAKRDEGQRERRKKWEEDEAQRVGSGRSPRPRPQSFRRPLLTATQKAACDKSVRTYTFLDYLYRLRIRANYDDAAVFIDGPENETDSYLLHKRMNFLASGLALITELRVKNLVGAAKFNRWADAFIANIPSGYSLGIKERRPML
jgi:hypothetical protein